MYNFGAGNLFLTPPIISPATVVTPVRVAQLQEISLDISQDTKELRGNMQFPLAIAKAAGKIEGKAKFATILGRTLTSIMIGATSAPGFVKVAADEAHTIPASPGPYTVTTTEHTVFKENLEVYDVSAGVLMECVAAGDEDTGKYSFASTGIYTFDAADAGDDIIISYRYAPASGGNTVSWTNQPMGSGTPFALDVFNTFNAKSMGWHLYSVVIPKLSIPLKSEDFTVQDIDFAASADDDGNIIDFYSED